MVEPLKNLKNSLNDEKGKSHGMETALVHSEGERKLSALVFFLKIFFHQPFFFVFS